MKRHPISATSVIVLLSAVVLGFVLFYAHSVASYAEPQATVAAALTAAAASDLTAFRNASTSGYYEDLIGHFGQLKYEQARSAYQEAYDRAFVRWREYRQRVETAAQGAFRRLHERVDTLGRQAVAQLKLDERMRLTEDRTKYADFVFEQGLKALPPEERKQIEDPAAFRSGREFGRFATREGWNLLSAEDRAALGSAAVLAPEMTPEKLDFLAKVGVAMLSPERKEAIAGISPAELSSPRTFMLKHGEDLARKFFSEGAIDRNVRSKGCDFADQDQRGSLLRGDIAICTFEIAVRGQPYLVRALLRKDGFDWKLDWLQPDFFEMRAAYPPAPPVVRASQPAEAPVAGAESQPEPVEAIRLPRAGWQRRPVPQGPAPLEAIIGMARRALVNPLLWLGAAVIFIAVMTVNYRRLRNETFVPEWLEGEHQLDEIALPTWFARTVTRLTNRRVLQVRLNWFLSRRRVLAVALDDIHSVVWRRYTNWFLIVIGLYFIGSNNAVALLLVMLGVEAKIHRIRFNTPFAQMLFTRVTLTSFQRKHFNEMAGFFRKAQHYWAQVRTQKQMPGPPVTVYVPEVDRDFLWGASVWLSVGVWMGLAILQRIFSPHVSLDGALAAPLLLGLPAGIAMRGRRDALLAGILGVVALLTVKFPSTPVGFGFSAGPGPDGGAPYFEQYLGVLAAVAAIALAGAFLARLSAVAALFAPVLWLGFVALFKPALALDTALYGKCALAVAAAVLWAWVDGAIRPEGDTTVSAPEAASAGASA